jgi:uncharacterized protein
MLDGLPTVIDPIELAEAGARLAGGLPCKSMARLAELSLSLAAEAQIDLRFGCDPRGHWTMQGNAKCALTVTCQRCLQPMGLEIHAPIQLALLRRGMPEEGLDLEDGVLAVSGTVSLPALIEDELLLALPMAPRHPLPECLAASGHGNPERPRPESPFHVLARRKAGSASTS